SIKLSVDWYLGTVNVLSNCCKTSDFFDLFECNSKQNGPKPIFSNRVCTTTNAAFLAATKSTFLLLASASAIILVMVWDFPVPGGPCKINVLFSLAFFTAFNWKLSAEIGKNKVEVGRFSNSS